MFFKKFLAIFFLVSIFLHNSFSVSRIYDLKAFPTQKIILQKIGRFCDLNWYKPIKSEVLISWFEKNGGDYYV